MDDTFIRGGQHLSLPQKQFADVGIGNVSHCMFA